MMSNDFERFEIVTFLRVTYEIVHNLSTVNSASWCLYSGAKSRKLNFLWRCYEKYYSL